ncbi:cold shock domain-containing protein [Kineococcus gypseus]
MVPGPDAVSETESTARSSDLELPMPHATVRWFDAERGFGFLAPEDGSPDVFVHASSIVEDGGPRVLREGQTVEFEAGENDRGPQALRVRVTSETSAGGAVGLLGTVNWYEPAKGYGFASPDGGGPDIFVHSSAIVTGGVVTEGQRVAFVVVEGERGPQAAHVVPLGPGAGLPVGVGGADGADGTVSWYDEDKGFGFIAPDSGAGDVFVHARSLAEGLTWLTEGDRVAYEVVSGDKGPQARDVQLVRGAEPAPPPRQPAPAGPARTGRREPESRGVPARAGEGVVARYDGERGFGFITPDAGGDDLFVHVSVVAGSEPLQQGDRVRYAVRQSDRGPQADRVERL